MPFLLFYCNLGMIPPVKCLKCTSLEDESLLHVLNSNVDYGCWFFGS